MQASEFKKYIVLGQGTLSSEDFELLGKFGTLESFGYKIIRPLDLDSFNISEGDYCIFIRAKQSRRLSTATVVHEITEKNPLKKILDSIIAKEQGIKNGSINGNVEQTFFGGKKGETAKLLPSTTQQTDSPGCCYIL